MNAERERLLQEYTVVYSKHAKEEENLRKSIHHFHSERFDLRDKRKEVIKTDNQLKSLQSVGQMIGEVLKELTTEKCTLAG